MGLLAASVGHEEVHQWASASIAEVSLLHSEPLLLPTAVQPVAFPRGYIVTINSELKSIT